MTSHFEREVEQLCQRIQSTPIDSWTVRNETLMQLKNVVETYGGHGPASEMFTPAVFRNMKEPIKAMISDLRSSNVRDCCEFLKTLSRVSRDAMRYLLRDVLQTVVEQIKVPNKVTSGYVDECIQDIIHHTTYKPAIAMFVTEQTTSKNKAAKEFCAEYVRLILEQWNGLDKEVDALQTAIVSGLEDASQKVRETSRSSYLLFARRFPHRGDAIKSALRATTLAQLAKAEEEAAAAFDEFVPEAADSLVDASMEVPDDTATVDVAVSRTETRPTHRTRPSSGSNASVHSQDEALPSHLAVGQRVLCVKAIDTPATIRFIGLTQFASGYWVGIELDAPVGKNNGTVKGETYFTCPDNCGLFVKPSQLRILEDAQPMKDSDLVKAHRAHKMYITRMVLNLNQALSLAEQYDAKINNNNGAALTDAELTTYLAEIEALQEQYQHFSKDLSSELAEIRSSREA